MIRHIVAWSFKEEFTPEENQAHAEKIKNALESLPDVISEIVSIRVVTDPAQTSSRDMLLTSLFKTEDDLKAYQVHPEHKKVSGFVRSVMTDRICLDFEE